MWELHRSTRHPSFGSPLGKFNKVSISIGDSLVMAKQGESSFVVRHLGRNGVLGPGFPPRFAVEVVSIIRITRSDLSNFSAKTCLNLTDFKRLLRMKLPLLFFFLAAGIRPFTIAIFQTWPRRSSIWFRIANGWK